MLDVTQTRDLTPTQSMTTTPAIPQKTQLAKPSFNLPTVTSTTTVTSLELVSMSVGVTTISDAMTIGMTITTAVDTVSFSNLPTSTKRNGGNRVGRSLSLLIFLGVGVFVGVV